MRRGKAGEQVEAPSKARPSYFCFNSDLLDFSAWEELTLTWVMGMTPLWPELFSATYQNITLQGSMMVSTSPREKGRSFLCSPNNTHLTPNLP